MTEPHETPEFFNSAEYTISITFRVAGGARRQTAHRRARKIAERLANAAARAAHVVEVTAAGGASSDGKPLTTERIRFSSANTGRGTNADPSKLDRYLDPEFERAVRSLDEANAAARRDIDADRERRKALGCMNTYRTSRGSDVRCLCAYCEPARHEHALDLAAADTPDPLSTPRCVCGRVVAAAGLRCSRHRGHDLAALDGDPPALQRLVARLQRTPPGRETDGPELPPPGL